MSVRLNRFIADCTGISRRKADELLAAGQVSVNGKIAVIGQVVIPEKQQVRLQGKLLQLQKKRYLLFHKPTGTITTRSDPEGRKTIYDLLPEKYHDLDPAGRLDRESSGVLLLSNDGDFLQTVTHPKFAHEKVYRVGVRQHLTAEALTQLEKGILLEPESKLAIHQVREIRDGKTVVLTLKTGINRQIRRSFEALSYEVTHLKRTSFAGITLGSLPPGKCRELKPAEVRRIMSPRSRVLSSPRPKSKRK
jgi:23S rRNA pseudouridine2605 synthase